MKPRLQTRSHAGGIVLHRLSEGHSAIAPSDRPRASMLLARTFVRRQTVESMLIASAARAAHGESLA
ncbi:MAG TPA: hypothetical protein VFY00_02935 [Arenimonas sp.]|nr:hypothetical protein [Arenimonas sp.]